MYEQKGRSTEMGLILLFMVLNKLFLLPLLFDFHSIMHYIYYSLPSLLDHIHFHIHVKPDDRELAHRILCQLALIK